MQHLRFMELKNEQKWRRARARSQGFNDYIYASCGCKATKRNMGQMERTVIQLPDCSLEVTFGGGENRQGPAVCASHPAGAFGQGPAELLQWTANTRVVCVNPRGIGNSSAFVSGQHTYTLEQMVDDIERVRQQLAIESWVFWGMSGGGWLGQIYAKRYPASLRGLILESICSCFRVRLADPSCVLSPFHPSWRPRLEHLGLLSPDSHAEVGDVNATEWVDVDGVGSVFRRCNGPALLVSPMAVTTEMRAAMPVLWTVDTRPHLSKICTPTLVICGDSDPIVPVAHARALHTAIPGSQFFLAVKGGHAPVTERRPEFAEVVQRFLASLPR